MEIGARLKEARETRNISLDDLQETTKIQKRYLVAIEKGELDILPGKFYARAFIKEYAIAVGLDANELLEDLQEEVPPAGDANRVDYAQMRRTRKESSPGKIQSSFSFIPTVIVVLLVIGIFFVAWTLYQKTATTDGTETDDQQDSGEIIRNKDENSNDSAEMNDDDSNEQSEDDEEEEEEDSEPDNQEPTFNVIEEGTGNSPESTLDFNDAGDEVLVTLESNNDTDTYLDVKNEDGESFYTGTFTSNESPKELDLSGEKKIHFNIGNATGLKIKINNIDLEYPIDPNNSVHQKLWININN